MLSCIELIMNCIYLLPAGGEWIMIIIFLTPLIIGLIAFIDILKHEFTGKNKLIWLIAVIFVPFIGAIAYFVIGRNQRITS